MGRTLANTMVNLGIVTSVDEALYQVRLGKYIDAMVFMSLSRPIEKLVPDEKHPAVFWTSAN